MRNIVPGSVDIKNCKELYSRLLACTFLLTVDVRISEKNCAQFFIADHDIAFNVTQRR